MSQIKLLAYIDEENVAAVLGDIIINIKVKQLTLDNYCKDINDDLIDEETTKEQLRK